MLSKECVTDSPPILPKYNVTKCKTQQFIEVHGEFIATVAGKHDLVANWPCCMLIASCLLAAKMCIDTFAIRVSELMPTRADDAKPQQESLDRSLQHAVDLFGP